MMKATPFCRARAFIQAVAAIMAAGNLPIGLAAAQAGGYQSRGHGEGCSGNKRAKSSFKQNKRKGL